MKFNLSPKEHGGLKPLREEIKNVEAEWEISQGELEELVGANPELQEMLDDLLDQCLRYTSTVLKEREMLEQEGPGPEYAEWDAQRSVTHTATVDTIRAFVRNLIKAGKSESQVFAVIPNPSSRAACGRFALTLTLSRGAEEIKGTVA